MLHYGDICELNGAELPPVDVITGGSPREKPKFYKVYRYIFPDGKCYIGITKNSIATRRDQGYQHNKSLQTAIRNVGFKNIIVDILEDGLSQDEAFEKEKFYILKFQANNPERGFNISKGGKCTFEGLHHTTEHKKRIQELYRGKKFTKKHLAHLQEAHKAERKEVIGIFPNGESIKFDSLGDAAEKINGYKTNISRACKSKKPYKGITWKFVEGGDLG